MKILYTILFFFSFEIKVSAINYNVWQEEKVNDLTLTYDEIKMYKWYKEEIKGEYLWFDPEGSFPGINKIINGQD